MLKTLENDQVELKSYMDGKYLAHYSTAFELTDGTWLYTGELDGEEFFAIGKAPNGIDAATGFVSAEKLLANRHRHFRGCAWESYAEQITGRAYGLSFNTSTLEYRAQ